jgi:hypothetical protein
LFVLSRAYARSPSFRGAASQPVSLNEAGRQPPSSSQPRFGARHTAAVFGVIVIVAKQMKETVKGEDAQLGGVRMTHVAGLTPGHTRRNDDVAEQWPTRSRTRRLAVVSGKGEDVGGTVDAPVFAIQLADSRVAHERHRNVPAG